MGGETAAPEALPRSVAEAVVAEEAGARTRFLFFWKPEPVTPGGVGPECLGQWWEGEFSEDGHVFRTAEHYMMAHKAWLFGDEEIAERVLEAGHPRDVKRLGRQVRGFDEAVWTERRSAIVTRGNLLKFGGSPALRDYLVGTRDRVLVEASPLDRIWGIGLGAGNADAMHPSRWRGLNLLGFALMDVRDTLISGASSAPGPA
ncbi:NADAR family protein [Streptomyces avicenniae]|uniref:NADAR family protein n=1 Tax=Streptomyces avicenniae TaxID=500153 RepID=UPI00069BBA14|nr:NADAR family protein [Streptomyces avicenniae]